MPWLATDRDAIAKYLCIQFQAQTLAQVSDAMARLELVSTQAITIAQTYLTRLAAITADIDTASTALTGGAIASSTDSNPVEFAMGQPLNILRDEGWRYVNLLAALLDLAIVANYFDVPTTATTTQPKQSNKLQRS
jgi:hypothetical protein